MSTTTPHTQTAYKDTPIGKIPADWEVKKIGEIFNSFPTASYSRADLVEEGEILYLHYGDIHTKFDFHLDVSKATLPSITEEKLKKYEVVKEGDWVLCDASEDYDGVGKSVEIVNLDDKKLIAGLHTFLLREKGNFFAPYFKGYVALNESVRKQFQKLATGTKVYSLSKETLLSVKIPLPPLSEQKRIAEVLSTWDKAIQLTEQLIRQKEQRKKWLMQNLLTGKMRLKGFSGTKWEDIELGEVLDYEQPTKYIVKNTNYSDSYSIPVLTAGKTLILGYTNEKDGIYSKLPVILFDDFTTASRYVNFPFKVKSSAIKLLKPKIQCCFKYIFEAMQMIKYTIGGHERHWISKYAYLTIPFPSLEEQTAIAEVLQTADKEIELLKAKAEQLKEQKKGLMQQLLTGKKRLL